jgi:hypothetical protein
MSAMGRKLTLALSADRGRELPAGKKLTPAACLIL